MGYSASGIGPDILVPAEHLDQLKAYITEAVALRAEREPSLAWDAPGDDDRHPFAIYEDYGFECTLDEDLVAAGDTQSFVVLEYPSSKINSFLDILLDGLSRFGRGRTEGPVTWHWEGEDADRWVTDFRFGDDHQAEQLVDVRQSTIGLLAQLVADLMSTNTDRETGECVHCGGWNGSSGVAATIRHEANCAQVLAWRIARSEVESFGGTDVAKHLAEWREPLVAEGEGASS
jgi:hypothetical protein